MYPDSSMTVRHQENFLAPRFLPHVELSSSNRLPVNQRYCHMLLVQSDYKAGSKHLAVGKLACW